MIPFRMSKTGWRVIGGAVEGGWGQTLRLILVLVALAILLMTVLISVGAVGGWVAQLAASGLSTVDAR